MPLRRPAGFTLMELLLSLSIVAAIGMLAVPALTRRGEHASLATTRQTLSSLRRAILVEYRNDMYESLPYPSDPAREQHPQLRYLYDNPAAYAAADPESIEQTQAWSHDPVTGRGWSGPYVDHAAGSPGRYQVDGARGFSAFYGADGDPAPVDAWGRPVVLQQPIAVGAIHSPTGLLYARLVSAGPDGILQTPLSVTEPTAGQQGDDIVLSLRAR